jgi:hypothetical protein
MGHGSDRYARTDGHTSGFPNSPECSYGGGYQFDSAIHTDPPGYSVAHEHTRTDGNPSAHSFIAVPNDSICPDHPDDYPYDHEHGGGDEHIHPHTHGDLHGGQRELPELHTAADALFLSDPTGYLDSISHPSKYTYGSTHDCKCGDCRRRY